MCLVQWIVCTITSMDDIETRPLEKEAVSSAPDLSSHAWDVVCEVCI